MSNREELRDAWDAGYAACRFNTLERDGAALRRNPYRDPHGALPPLMLWTWPRDTEGRIVARENEQRRPLHGVGWSPRR